MFNSMAVWGQEMGDGDIFIGCKDEFCCQVVMVIMVMVMTSCCCPLGLFVSRWWMIIIRIAGLSVS